jgi:hypothetical protein
MGDLAVAELLGRLPAAPDRAVLPGRRDGAAAPAVAERFLARLEPADRAILVLVLGLGLDLGTVAFVLQLDPSIVAWRLRRTLLAEAEGADPVALERGVTRWLRSPAAARAGGASHAGSNGRAQTVAAGVFAALPAEVHERLALRLGSPGQDGAMAGRRPGLGIGSLVLILVAAAGFMVYGAVRDVNPLWRGMGLVRQGEYAAARTAFQELGALAEGRAWIAITWLAEGDYEHALGVLAEPDTARYLGEFRPVDTPLPRLDASASSLALLPRGLTAEPRPTFVYLADGATALTLEQQHADQPGKSRKVRVPLPDAGKATGVVRLAYPAEWPDLAEGVVLWDVAEDEEGELEPTSFTVLERDARRSMAQKAAARLTHEIPSAAREFLRAHFDLRNGLLAQAGGRFALLAELFPDQAYPRQMVERIGAALGVDPAVLVR